MLDETLILELLHAHEEAFDRWPELTTRYRVDDHFTNTVLENIERGFDSSFSVEQAYRLFREFPEQDGTWEKARVLHEILRLIDGYYSNFIPRRFESNDEVLILGRRWWSTRERALSGNSMRSKSNFYVFPHLRRVRCPESSWHNVGVLDAYDPAMQSERLRIGLCTFSGQAQTWFRGTVVVDNQEKVFGFRAARMGHPEPSSSPGEAGGAEEYVEELRGCARWALEAQVQILCLPELSVCPRGLEVLKEELGERPESLRLVVPGSFHFPRSGVTSEERWSNAAPIWLFDPDAEPPHREIARAVKADLFGLNAHHVRDDPRMEEVCDKARVNGCGSLREDVHADAKIQVLDTPLGLIGVLICKDMLFARNPARANLLEIIDHLIVVSMNSSPKAEFLALARKHTQQTLTATFYVNSAQMNIVDVPKGVEAAFGLLPSSRRITTGELFYRTSSGPTPPSNPPLAAAAPPWNLVEQNREGRYVVEIHVPPTAL